MKSLKTIFKHHPTTIHAGDKINPHAHWMILLRVFFLLLLFLILFSLYLLYQIKNDQIFQIKGSRTAPPSLLKESLLKSTTDSFDQKAKKESDLQSTPTTYQDPSL